MSAKPNKAQFGMQFGVRPGSRPPVAVELMPEGVLAAALPSPGEAPIYAFQALPAGAILPGIGDPNLRAPEAVAEAIRAVLGQVSARGRSVTLVLPDATVRVFVLDFDALSSNPAEALPVLRFRLRKMVPFDVEHASLSYQILNETKSEVKVLAAVLPGAILAEYEAAVRAAGYEPGAVLPSSLAALATIDSLEAVLMANLTHQTLTTAITNGNDLLLYRTLDLPDDAEQQSLEVKRGIAVAAAFFEDKLGAPPLKVHYAGSYGNEVFAGAMRDQELAVSQLVDRPETGAVTSLGDTSLAGIAGALAGTR